VGWVGIVLRDAVVSDIDWILVELKQFAEFYASSHSLFSDDDGYNRTVLKQLIEGHYFIVSENDGIVSGFIAGMISKHLFNPKISTITELFWWVKPEYRRSGAGGLLLQEFTEFGKQFTWVIMTLENDSPVKPASIVKMGYKFKEQSFIKENI